MPALLKPEQAAEAILQGWKNGDFEIHFPKRFTRWVKALGCCRIRPTSPPYARPPRYDFTTGGSDECCDRPRQSGPTH